MTNITFKVEKEKRLADAQRIASLYEVLRSYAPDNEAYKACQVFTNRADTTDKEIVLELVVALSEGILCGNWPWLRPTIREK